MAAPSRTPLRANDGGGPDEEGRAGS